ncbi:beta-N-acetylglucosaminidase domain-containing protein [Bifidobacterium bifidum]|uniref:beta-N-acetylglucosaminidase domain-containing protein n=3 Tax=Bifidobacterium bifidum TaxID=1681 RepID=UPI0011068538|nr:beta-N-acetylglucosaminidase domain-containing protein [Bifidobacterium bifidum]MDB1291401.1 beta-N-acetylglucosaminidase domain-containing protein [Bifidobacterium bifidum]MDB1296848.1 beta-N-acetylglucosaminidase domain-containing protein [Bifidobacterium bifidum]MDB1298142.1 beta-N-acetylglucosaminidase domain-containing protein [Bifidobacterium bifidum]
MRANGNSTHEILGKIVTAIASIAMTAAFAVPAMAASDSDTAADSGTTQQSGQYKIYPQPQNTEYGDGSLILRDKANTVVEPGIDSATKARLNEALKLKGIETTAADAVPETAYQLNVLVGINGSNGVVDKYAKQLIADGTLKVDDSTFSKNDSYVLAVRQGNAKTPDTILVLGRDTDSAFYGLTTLYQIFQQLPGRAVSNLTFSDWADVKSRGFIEGYYGSPWSTKDRVNLMTWGGYYKMNTYVYAPKDDPLHRNNWRGLYTEDQIENEIKPQAEAGNKSKVRFVYALAPFHNDGEARGKHFRFDTEEHYQEDLKELKAKYMQTIDAGVRQIALLADDSTDWGAQYGNDNTYVRVLKDLTDWIHELQQEKNDDGTAKYEGLKDTILYCPALYSYTGAGDAWYKDIPSNVQIVMTGGRTFGVASKDFADTFTKNTGRAPFMWINWPCSDMNRNTAYQYLVMGGQNNFLKPGATYGTYDGIMLNPMQQSEPSKQGIFMAADYSWNLWQSEKDGQQSWEDSFSYIDHNSPIASKGSRGLRDLAMNMRILNDGGIDGAHKDAEYDAVNKWWINNESVDYTGKLDVKGVLTELKGKLDGGTATAADFSQALTVYTTLQRAAKNYRANPGDKNMFDQIEPWISYWDDLTASAIDYITAAKQALAGDTEAAKATYATAKAAFAKSDTHTIADYYQRNKPARGGLVIVRPTVQALDSFVKAKTSGSVTPTPSDATVSTNGVGAAAWHENVDPKAVIDGDDSTFFWMQSAGCDCVKANAALTVTYAEARKAKEFRFIQAEKGGDTIVNGKIEYQDADGNWTKIGDVNGNQKQIFTLDSAATVKAVRITNLAQTSKWWKVYDLSATKIDEPGTVTKDALNAKVAEAEKVDSADWTKSSREALAGAIAAAKAVAADQDATQAKVDAAVAALESAMKGVERYTAKTADQLKAEHVSNDNATYTEASYNKYQSAYDDFAAALANADDLAKADGEALEAAYTAAKSTLRYDQSARDYAQLALNDAEPYAGKASEYTKDSYAKFTVAYEALSKQLKADPNGEGDPATYTALRAALDKAIKGLVKSDGTEPERPGEKPGENKPGENKPGEKPGVNKPGADGKLSNTGADVFGLIAAMTMLAAAGVTMAGLRKRIG